MEIFMLFICYLDNEIGPAGCHNLLIALQKQTKFLDYGTGILKLSLQYNAPSKYFVDCRSWYIQN